MGDNGCLRKQVVFVEESPNDDPHVNSDTKEIAEAAILGVGSVDFLSRAALDILCHHVELVDGADVPLPLGLWQLRWHHGRQAAAMDSIEMDDD